MPEALQPPTAENKIIRFAAAHPEATIFVMALLLLAATSADRMLRQSQAPHFVYQAEAFLHGQLHLRVPPPNDNDWIVYGGKHYVSFPPVPAVLMMPLVALFGLKFNDVLFTIPFAALNVMLMFMVLELLRRENFSSLGRRENLWLTALFGFTPAEGLKIRLYESAATLQTVTRLSQATARWAGKPQTFAVAVSAIVIWGLSGPFFGFNDTWQLVINTSTTIITFLMVFIIQNSQNRDTAAMQIKLDELLAKVEGARQELMDLEELDEEKIEGIRKDFEKRARAAREGRPLAEEKG